MMTENLIENSLSDIEKLYSKDFDLYKYKDKEQKIKKEYFQEFNDEVVDAVWSGLVKGAAEARFLFVWGVKCILLSAPVVAAIFIILNGGI